MEKFEYGLLGSKLDELINVPDHSIRYLDGKKVSTVLLFNQGQILAVSRKDDPNDFGLPGGKLDPGETFTAGAIREVREETGLHIFGLIPIFGRVDGNFFAICFVAQYSGEIDHTLESGVVKWTPFETITKGSFGKYNLELGKFIQKRGWLPKDPNFRNGNNI